MAGQLHRACISSSIGAQALNTPPRIHAIDPCSKPTVTAVNAGGNKYTVTITPVTTTPLKSYPAGGWAYYTIATSSGLQNQGFSCT